MRLLAAASKNRRRPSSRSGSRWIVGWLSRPASADALRNVIERYPDERELLERARLYLKVCERELEPKEPAPKTPDEWVYAATVSLNQGDEARLVPGSPARGPDG